MLVHFTQIFGAEPVYIGNFTKDQQEELSIISVLFCFAQKAGKARLIQKMAGRNAIVTGGNAGLGLATAENLCKLGYNVTISVRSVEKGEEAVSHIRSQTAGVGSADYLVMDLTDLSSVGAFAAQYKARNIPLHLLINNAGIMNTPFKNTVNGIEEQFQVNHLSHFLLTHLLFSALRMASNARVVCLSSRAHLRWGQPLDMNAVTNATADKYDGWQSYGRSKTCNILFVRSLAAMCPITADGPCITFNALHPGLVNTGLLVKGNLGKSTIASALPVEEGVKTTLYLATADEVNGVTGQYFSECRVVQGSEVSKWAQSDSEAQKLFDASMAMCGLQDGTFGQP